MTITPPALTQDTFPADPDQADIIDETLDLFRANSLFRNFEIKGPADRLLIVLILFVSDCLAKIGTAKTVPAQIEASKMLNTLSVDNFPIPGDANFALNAHYAVPGNRADAGSQPRSACTPLLNNPTRLSPHLFDTSSPRTRCSTSGTVVCRWQRETEQMVDGISKETIHES